MSLEDRVSFKATEMAKKEEDTKDFAENRG